MRKAYGICLNTIPVLVMLGLIPLISDDYLLSVAYLGIILLAFSVKRLRNDLLVFVLGFVIMTASEYLFIMVGVETFNRRTLFGVMPLWLPVLWAYCFVVIKRSVEILDQ